MSDSGFDPGWELINSFWRPLLQAGHVSQSTAISRLWRVGLRLEQLQIAINPDDLASGLLISAGAELGDVQVAVFAEGQRGRFVEADNLCRRNLVPGDGQFVQAAISRLDPGEVDDVQLA